MQREMHVSVSWTGMFSALRMKKSIVVRIYSKLAHDKKRYTPDNGRRQPTRECSPIVAVLLLSFGVHLEGLR